MSAHFYVTPAFGSEHYSAAQKKLLKETFVMGAVESLPLSVVVCQGLVQHAGSEWRSEHCICYYSYTDLENCELPDGTAFAYGESIAFGA